MKIEPERLLGPLVAALVLALVVQQTVGALRAAGVWGHRHERTFTASPYAHVETLLARPDSRADSGVTRNPFAFVSAPSATPARPVARHAPAAPPPPPRPVLTAIIWSEASPSATIRWDGRDYSVQVNTLFDDFRVAGITRDQVTLERGGETLVLQLPKKGD